MELSSRRRGGFINGLITLKHVKNLPNDAISPPAKDWLRHGLLQLSGIGKVWSS
jgi:hypothetical protein